MQTMFVLAYLHPEEGGNAPFRNINEPDYTA
jgi:hypothetical protein